MRSEVINDPASHLNIIFIESLSRELDKRKCEPEVICNRAEWKRCQMCFLRRFRMGHCRSKAQASKCKIHGSTHPHTPSARSLPTHTTYRASHPSQGPFYRGFLGHDP